MLDTWPIENFDVGLRFMNYHVPYGYELLPSSPGYIYTSFSERCILTLAGALATNMGALVRGPNNVSKRSAVKVFSHLTAYRQRALSSLLIAMAWILIWLSGFSRQGMAAGAFWVMFENIQNLDFGLLPSFGNIASKEHFLALLTLACRYWMLETESRMGS
jgi:hypothetical protein